MNKSTLVLLLALAVACGAVYYLEEQKVQEYKQLVASLQAGSAELTATNESQRKEIETLRAQEDTFKAEAAQLRQQLAAQPAAAQPQGNDPANPAPADAAKAEGQPFMKNLAKMFTDPEMKKSMRVQQLVGIRMMYGDLVKELGLSAEDGELVFEILADRQMDLSSSAVAAMNGDAAAADQEANQKKTTETQQRYAEQLKATLGEERYAKLQSYEGSIGDRFMLQQFEGQFTTAGSPLEKAQKDQLLELMRTERQNTPPDQNVAMNSRNPREQMGLLKSEDAEQRFVKQQQEFNGRVLAKAKGFLNAGQIATFEKVQEQQVEFMKVQIKMSRQMMGLGK